MPENMENSAVPTGPEKFSFHSNSKERQAKECSNDRTIALISHTSKVMLKILQARLQLYVNWELPDIQAGFRKGRGTRDQIANICWIIGKARKFQKNIYFCFIGDFPGGLDGKASVCNAGDLGSTPGSGRSPGEGNGKPPQYLPLENPMDRGTW